MSDNKEREPSYARQVLTLAPVFATKAVVGDIPKGGVEFAVEQKLRGSSDSVRALLRRGLSGRGLGRAIGATAGVLTAPAYVGAVRKLRSDDPAKRREGLAQLAVTTAAFSALKGGLESAAERRDFSVRGLSSGLRGRGLARLVTKTPLALLTGMALAKALNDASRKKEGPPTSTSRITSALSPVLLGAATGMGARLSENAVEHVLGRGGNSVGTALKQFLRRPNLKAVAGSGAVGGVLGLGLSMLANKAADKVQGKEKKASLSAALAGLGIGAVHSGLVQALHGYGPASQALKRQFGESSSLLALRSAAKERRLAQGIHAGLRGRPAGGVLADTLDAFLGQPHGGERALGRAIGEHLRSVRPSQRVKRLAEIESLAKKLRANADLPSAGVLVANVPGGVRRALGVKSMYRNRVGAALYGEGVLGIRGLPTGTLPKAEPKTQGAVSRAARQALAGAGGAALIAHGGVVPSLIGGKLLATPLVEAATSTDTARRAAVGLLKPHLVAGVRGKPVSRKAAVRQHVLAHSYMPFIYGLQDSASTAGQAVRELRELGLKRTKVPAVPSLAAMREKHLSADEKTRDIAELAGEAIVDKLMTTGEAIAGKLMTKRAAAEPAVEPKPTPKFPAPGMKPSFVPMEHQEQAVTRLFENNGRMIMAHETGTGKTATGIYGFEAMRGDGKAKKALVIVPSGLRHNFTEGGVARFTNSSYQIVGPANEARTNKKVVTAGNIANDKDYTVVSYDMFRRDPQGIVERSGADTLILDEFHKARNESASTYDAIMGIRDKVMNVIGLTASPINNNPAELASLLTITEGERVLSPSGFKRAFLTTVGRAPGFSGGEKPVTDFKNVPQLVNYAYPRMHYVATEDVKGNVMPKKVVTNVHVPMSDEQYDLYEYALNKLGPLKRYMMRNDPNISLKDAEMMFTAMAQARKVANSLHTGRKDMTPERAADATPKVRRVLDDTVEHLQADPKNSVVLYSNLIHGGVDVLTAGLKKRGIDHAVFVGKDTDVNGTKVTSDMRQEGVREFQQGKKRVIVLSGAGAEGLDLKDSTAFFALDGHFNPERIMQAEARARRLGGQQFRAPEDRKVDVRRYYSVVPESRTPGFFKRVLGVTPERTTDQWMYNVAEMKQDKTQKFQGFLRQPHKYIRKYRNARGEWKYVYPPEGEKATSPQAWWKIWK